MNYCTDRLRLKSLTIWKNKTWSDILANVSFSKVCANKQKIIHAVNGPNVYIKVAKTSQKNIYVHIYLNKNK